MADSPTSTIGPDFAERLVGFGRALREAGLPIGTGDLLTYGSATALLDPADLVDVYWSGRTTLVTRVEQLPTYDRIFARYVLDDEGDEADPSPYTVKQRTEVSATLQLPDPEATPDGTRDDEQEARMGLVASDVGTIRHRAFNECSPEELVALRRVMRRMRLVPPRRRSRRTRPHANGREPDLRRTVREIAIRPGTA